MRDSAGRHYLGTQFLVRGLLGANHQIPRSAPAPHLGRVRRRARRGASPHPGTEAPIDQPAGNSSHLRRLLGTVDGHTAVDRTQRQMG